MKIADKMKEKILLARKSQLYKFCDLVNGQNIQENLTQLLGFFFVQQYLHKFCAEFPKSQMISCYCVNLTF